MKPVFPASTSMSPVLTSWFVLFALIVRLPACVVNEVFRMIPLTRSSAEA